MAKRVKFIALGIVILISLLACQVTIPSGVNLVSQEIVKGSGEMATEIRNLTGVTGVSVDTFGDMQVEIGDREQLVIVAEDNLLPYLDSEVRNGVLHVTTKSGINLQPTEPIKYSLTVKQLDQAFVTSLGSIHLPSLESKTFAAEINSVGSITLEDLRTERAAFELSSVGSLEVGELFADKLTIKISSAGSVNIAGGEIEEQDVSLSSMGSYNAANLQSQRADVEISSSGSATIRVSDWLKAFLSSIGGLKYYGNPDVDIEETSVGRVVRLGE